jgi:hypothetical protein
VVAVEKRISPSLQKSIMDFPKSYVNRLVVLYEAVEELIPVLLGLLVNVLCYKSEGRWFDSRWCHMEFFIDTILPIGL